MWIRPQTPLVLTAFLVWALGLATVNGVQAIREIQRIGTMEPFEPQPVAAEGTVTWADESAGKLFYMQDATGGIRVTFQGDTWPKVGDTVRVRGTLTRGPFSMIVADASFEVTGTGVLPEAMRASGGGLLNGAYNGERVDVDGWVRSAEMVSPGTLAFILESGTARITVRVSNAWGWAPEKLIASHARALGVSSPVKARGTIRQLVEVQVLVATPEDLIISRWEDVDPLTLPPISLRRATQYRPGGIRGDRIRVRGQVIHRENNVVYLHDGETGLAVRGPNPPATPGAWIEAIGFLDMEESLPVLSDSIFLPAEEPGPPVTPKEIPPEALLDGLQHANYVTVTGTLLDQMIAPAAKGSERTLTLVFQAPHGVFTGELDIDSSAGQEDAFEIGSVLRFSGICLVQTDVMGQPTGFKILVPDPGQIEVVQAASFFTVPRLLAILSVTLGILLSIVSLAYYLARRNAKLRREMRERRTIAAERSRLARDLHDTLEQGLTGIHLQLHSIGPSLEEAPPETQQRLGLIRSLVYQCHDEMRRSIWNLRSGALENFDLGQALERSAHSLVLGSDIKVELRQQRNGLKIPPLIEDNLLRIGQEALTNAVKHAAATRLTIDLNVTEDAVVLEISDNGSGIDASHVERGHFGLDGMRERASRLGGRLEITGVPGQGSRVRVEAPMRKTNALSS